MRKKKIVYYSLIATLLFWLYIAGKTMYVYSSLEPIQGTITKVEKSGNRIPVYTINLQEYNSSFSNTGNGTLSLLKKVPEENSDVFFYIRKADIPKTTSNDTIFNFGLHGYTLIDCYYFVVRPHLLQHIFILFCSFILCCLHAYSYARYSSTLSWRLLIASLLLLLQLMLL